MYPKKLMSEVSWGFFGGKYKSLTKFIQAVTEYNHECDKKWNPNAVVLENQKVIIQYAYWGSVEEDVVETEFDLETNNQSGFTADELLFKIHNQIVGKLEDEDHHFFEGLTLLKTNNSNNTSVPTYFINQESLNLYG
jgi:hypothetical protein